MIASMRKHTLANPVLLGGDVHQNWVGHVKADYAESRKSRRSASNSAGRASPPAPTMAAKISDLLARNPHFVFANAERRGYGVVDFTPQRLTTSLRVVDDVTQRDTHDRNAGEILGRGRTIRYSRGMKNASVLPLWTIATPIVAWLLFGGTLFGLGGAYLALVAAGLIGGVLSAVHHAEVVAHRVGEPFGTLVLAVAVTVIEVALIVSLMLAGGPATTALARDTVFAAVMIILTGMVGLVPARRRRAAPGAELRAPWRERIARDPCRDRRAHAVLPNYLISDPGPVFTPSPARRSSPSFR